MSILEFLMMENNKMEGKMKEETAQKKVKLPVVIFIIASIEVGS